MSRLWIRQSAFHVPDEDQEIYLQARNDLNPCSTHMRVDSIADARVLCSAHTRFFNPY